MADLLARETETYTDVWQVEAYSAHSPGAALVPLFLDMTGRTAAHAARYAVLDAGCGAGAGALALAALGFQVRLCDLTDVRTAEARALEGFAPACLWHPLAPQLGYLSGGRVDYVYCCDVLEHVPTALTMLAVGRMLDVTRVGLFLSIAFVPDRLGVWVGKALHQTVQPFTWWRDNLAAVGTVREARDCFDSGVFLVEPRR